MDSIRKFFANFQRHGTITQVIKTSSNEAKTTKQNDSVKIAESDLRSNTEDLKTKEGKALKEPKNFTIESLKSGNGISEAPILEESMNLIKTNREVTDESTLNDIEEVITRQLKETFETPRFDLQDVINDFDLYVDNNIDSELVDLGDIYDPSEMLTDETDSDINNETSEVYYKEKNINGQADVISISSEDSNGNQELKCEPKKDMNIKKYQNVEPKNVIHKNEEIFPETIKPNDINEETDSISQGELVKSQNAVFQDHSYRAVHPEQKYIKTDESECEDVKNKEITDKSLNLKDHSKELDDITIAKLLIHGSIRETHDREKDEPKNVNEQNAESDSKSQELVLIDDRDDCESNDIKIENQESENVNIENENPKNIYKESDIASIDSDNCGYRSSDFEFITEDEAKMGGLIVNCNSNIAKRKISNSKRVKTTKVAIDQYSNIHSPEEIHPGTSLQGIGANGQKVNGSRFDSRTRIQENDPRYVRSSLRNVRKIRYATSDDSSNNINNNFNSNCTHGPSNIDHAMRNSPRSMFDERNGLGPSIQINCTGTSNFIEINCTGHDRQGNGPETNNLGELFSCRPAIYSHSYGSNNFSSGPRQIQGDHHGPENFAPGPSQIQGVHSRSNNFGHESSQVQGDCPESTSFGPGNGNYPDTSDPNIEKWRSFQQRHQRRKFIIDHSYRETHRMPIGDDYHRLFANAVPTPRLSENKSTLSLMMHQGFDVVMIGGESEEDEVKEEANESARKILEMYPAENRKRRLRLRRRF